jgi:hypothetical protein
VSYTDDERDQLERAEGIAFAASLLLNHAAQSLRRVHERHPLYYRTNQILRNLDELHTELRREQGK